MAARPLRMMVCGVLVLMLWACTAEALEFGIRDLGTFGSTTLVRRVSDNGRWAVGSGRTPGSTADHAILWDLWNETYQDLDPLLSESYAYGVNDSGVVVGRRYRDGQWRATIWDTSTSMVTDYTWGTGDNRFYAVNNDSKVAGRHPSGSTSTAMLWHESITTDLSGTDGFAFDVNGAGVPVGYRYTSGVRHGVRWDTAAGADLLADTWMTNAAGINDSGVVCGWRTVSDTENAGTWDAGNNFSLLPGGTYFSRAYGISGSGDVVGMAGAGSVLTYAALWSGGSSYNLNGYLTGPDATGWDLRDAYDISSNSRWIVGTGTKGGLHGYLLEAPGAVPEPASCALLALAAGGIGAMLKRRRKA